MTAPESRFVVHVVPHTHWDREWYHPLGRFRQRLVELIDELLDAPTAGPRPNEAVPFLLDGQAVILEDYLTVRPERLSDLTRWLAESPIEAGPWYVLADELIPGGEALVRNLLAGRRMVRRVGGASPPVLYSPDSFGHPAALPTLAAGFGLALAMVWRGYGGPRWPAGDAVWWEAPDGARVLLYHLPRAGYEFGSSLPTDAATMAGRWREMRDELAPRARLGHLLVQNGADHHAPQRGLAESFALLARAASPDEVRWSTLGDFAAAAVRAAATLAELPTVRGELRDSYGYSWVLQGALAARAQQKRRNAHAERALVRGAEPWAALARQRGGRSRAPQLRAAWQTLLSCHPHDTLCGCSADAVARAMEVRLDSALVQAAGVRDDSLLDVIGHDLVEARDQRPRWQRVCVVRNAAPRSRSGVAEVELETFVRDVAVGPGSGVRRAPPLALPGAPLSLRAGQGPGAIPLQLLDRRLEQRRTESPRHYPDNDLVEVASAVAWVDGVGGYGTRAYAVGGELRGGASVPAPVVATNTTLDNGALRLAVDAHGEVRLTTAAGYESPPLVSFEDLGDAGDLYTHSPTGAPVTTAWFVGARLVHRGPLRGEVECRWRMRVPAALRPDEPGAVLPARPARAGRPVEIPLTVRFVLDAGARHVGATIEGVNSARDHRLRVLLHTGIVDATVVADAAFGPVARRPIVVSAAEAAVELPPPTAPFHRYVSLLGADAGVTLFSDGLAEYEAFADGRIAVTLVRAVGELSRNDLPERPGHAGWPTPTPEAQCPGPFAARFALLPHVGGMAETLALVEEVADDAFLPLTGTTLRSALALPPPTFGAELSGRGLTFGALMESECGGWTVARCVNVTGDAVDGAWRFGFPVHEAMLARLDETPLAPAAVDAAGSVHFTAGPRAVVTVLVR